MEIGTQTDPIPTENLEVEILREVKIDLDAPEASFTIDTSLQVPKEPCIYTAKKRIISSPLEGMETIFDEISNDIFKIEEVIGCVICHDLKPNTFPITCPNRHTLCSDCSKLSNARTFKPKFQCPLCFAPYKVKNYSINARDDSIFQIHQTLNHLKENVQKMLIENKRNKTRITRLHQIIQKYKQKRFVSGETSGKSTGKTSDGAEPAGKRVRKTTPKARQ